MEELSRHDPPVVAGYRLLARLGGGGMGRVYLAAHSPGRSPVALKLIRPEVAEDPQFRVRFTREVEAARRLGKQRFTAAILDADPEAEQPWMASEYVPGISLYESVFLHGALPEETVRTLGYGLATALVGIHGCGLAHRDLKPSNIMLSAQGPTIIDFGIARATDATQVTRTGLLLGSPGFMSPEQIEGAEVSSAGDVFSLGTVLANAATGSNPFGEGAAPTMLYRIVNVDPNLEDVPEGLRELIRRCLSRDPQERPTAAEVAQELAPRSDTGEMAAVSSAPESDLELDVESISAVVDKADEDGVDAADEAADPNSDEAEADAEAETDAEAEADGDDAEAAATPDPLLELERVLEQGSGSWLPEEPRRAVLDRAARADRLLEAAADEPDGESTDLESLAEGGEDGLPSLAEAVVEEDGTSRTLLYATPGKAPEPEAAPESEAAADADADPAADDVEPEAAAVAAPAAAEPETTDPRRRRLIYGVVSLVAVGLVIALSFSLLSSSGNSQAGNLAGNAMHGSGSGASGEPSASRSLGAGPSASASASASPSRSASPSASPTKTASASPTASPSPTFTATPSPTATATSTASAPGSSPCSLQWPNANSCTSSDPAVTIYADTSSTSSGCTYTYRVNWGDGSSQTVSFKGGSGGSVYLASHTYQGTGTFNIAQNADGGCALLFGYNYTFTLT